jgi:hypothetical protein
MFIKKKLKTCLVGVHQAKTNTLLMFRPKRKVIYQTDFGKQCPSDITDQIGGWATNSVGQGYGSGYSLNVLQEWMEKTV